MQKDDSQPHHSVEIKQKENTYDKKKIKMNFKNWWGKSSFA